MSQGHKSRTKQADPAPLPGSSSHPHAQQHVGKRKQKLIEKASSTPATTTDLASSQSNGKQKVKRASTTDGHSQSKRLKTQQGSSSSSNKKQRRSSNKNVNDDNDDDDDDDLTNLREQRPDDEQDWSDLDEDAINATDAKNLEAARSAFFNEEDLEEPDLQDDSADDDDDDEFDLDRADDDDDDDDEDEDEDEELEDEFGLDAEENPGVTLDDFEMTAAEAAMLPPSGKKAAKRAASKIQAYDSDDEEQAKLGPPTERARKQVDEQESEEEDDVGPTMSDLEGMGSDDEDDEDQDDQNSDDDVEQGPLTDLRAVERRMRTSARILANWKKLGSSSGKSRSELIEQTVGDICQYYGYTPYLAEKLFDLFGPEEAIQFFNTSDTPRPLTIRVNTLKARRRDLAQALINRGVNLQPLEGGWSKVGLQVFSGGGVPIGATPEYLAGHYILQSASSFLPVVALDPQPHERVLDMSAAPGGKTTYMSALMGNTGEVWANDSSRGRIKGLGGNVARLGCRNVVITNVDGREFPKLIGGFDRVLLDAPCSGTGVISKDQSVKVNKTERDFILLSHLQKQLVLCAIDSVSAKSDKGGYVVYSTCSVTTEENEAVVSYALRKRPHVKLVDTGIPFGKEGFKSFRGKQFGKDIHLTRRFYPHVHNMDGFYVAKFKIGKPQKSKANADDEDEPMTGEPFIFDDETPQELTNDGPTFDDAQDTKLIEQSMKRWRKNKGINPKANK
ncbi:rRNA (cytosine-C5-)-methyltransferase nop2 [Microbotryomycetes sp. JL221]|nr:rRNA (cytosine-C5-)-methyltransferase nop2 [Microbotryomycetes sp. JL221]